jgi:predicted metal-binding membrane protein
MDAMPMPGDAASFLGMWIAMMAAMMLPSLAPMLWRARRHGALTALVVAGYFFVWTLVGLLAYLLSATLMAFEMNVPAAAHAAPYALGVIVLIAGALQFTAWKAHHLACCRSPVCKRSWGNGAASALHYGLRLGFHCSCCCAGSTAILLICGFMNVGAMLLATAAITAERLAPSGERVARLIGVFVIGTGLWLVAQAA